MDIQQIFNRLSFGAAIMGLEQNLFQQIEDVTPMRLKLLIDENKPIIMNARIRQWAVPMYQRFYSSLQFFTIPYILKVLANKRPDLFEVIINHPNADMWCTMRYQEILQQLAGYTPPAARPKPRVVAPGLPNKGQQAKPETKVKKLQAIIPDAAALAEAEDEERNRF